MGTRELQTDPRHPSERLQPARTVTPTPSAPQHRGAGGELNLKLKFTLFSATIRLNEKATLQMTVRGKISLNHMRKNIDNVEIVEPPIGELSKKYSTFSTIKRTCMAGCGCLVFIIIAAAIALKFLMGAGPTTLKNVPQNFPADIPVYDQDNIERITYISGKYKNRGVEVAAFFPKIILSPLFLSMDKNQPERNSDENKFISSAKSLWKIIRSPVSDHRDTVQIEWKNLDAEPTFVINYYKTELRKEKYKIDLESEGRDVKQFSFSKGNISGSIYVQGDEELKPGTDYAVLTVNIGTSTTK